MKQSRYKGYLIHAFGRRSSKTRWAAQAVVYKDEGRSIKATPILDEKGRTFRTEKEAETLGIRIARAWIDHQASGSSG